MLLSQSFICVEKSFRKNELRACHTDFLSVGLVPVLLLRGQAVLLNELARLRYLGANNDHCLLKGKRAGKEM